ncbi:MAG TPA: hypothetical protein VML36_04475 [Nitrospiria bacterium]|nr:hypothetical protein [Nitrospiria bacterium]
MALISSPLIADEAADQQAERAKQTLNPVADLISPPLQNNWDFNIGQSNAIRYTLNFQPVIPVSVDKDWNVIIRTIVPVIYAESPVTGGPNKGGLGDTNLSFFLSPTALVGGWFSARGRSFSGPPPPTDSARTNGARGRRLSS